jgi:predicted O-linked N-acetylglucosamine transferase (SPINDLY family)
LISNEFRAFYDEKIIYLPNYQINDRLRPHNNHLISKSSLGIPENHFVFACLNNSFKYQPEIFAAWMQILSDTPNSSLVLFGKNHLVSENLSAQAINANIDPSRMIFFNSVDYETYLSRLNGIDLFLDTTIYNAGTTASDALWMGIPVITCIGRSFCARMAASVLVAAGMPNLITQSLTDYIQLAIELASDQAKYQAIKTQLIDNSVACKLFDSPATTRNLERAYQLVWDNYLNHVPPEDLVISTSPVSGPRDSI